MTVEWNHFIDALGKNEQSVEFFNLCHAIGESPSISSDSDEYNDPLGKTKYYKFYNSGIEVGFRNGLLNHVHFYFYKEDGFLPFMGNLILGVAGGMDKAMVTKLLGKPSLSGEGKKDILLGDINAWSKYEWVNNSIHFQFKDDENLCRATLIRQ
ncbi:hypothetical protein P5M00_22015 (plasmid) [Enterobacter asburiae]|uniref:hypothetical protein n=1 Tax=Enterobacter asburiae TaxID=61645 RepID=UPI003855A3C1